MKLLLLVTWVAPAGVLAQVEGDGWGIVGAYGAAAPFALLCLWIITRKDKEIDDLRTQITTVTEQGMGQVVPALVHSTTVVAEAARALEAAMTMIHQLTGRAPSADTLDRIYHQLRRLESLER